MKKKNVHRNKRVMGFNEGMAFGFFSGAVFMAIIMLIIAALG
ncbi:hypothetical protein [Rhodococcus qingshengii]